METFRHYSENDEFGELGNSEAGQLWKPWKPTAAVRAVLRAMPMSREGTASYRAAFVRVGSGNCDVSFGGPAWEPFRKQWRRCANIAPLAIQGSVDCDTLAIRCLVRVQVCWLAVFCDEASTRITFRQHPRAVGETLAVTRPLRLEEECLVYHL